MPAQISTPDNRRLVLIAEFIAGAAFLMIFSKIIAGALSSKI